MLGKCVCVASGLLLVLLLSDSQTQSVRAGERDAHPSEQQAAAILRVPVPVPAKRPTRTSLPPPPPPPPPVQQVDPIENLAGRWSGEGTMVGGYGRNEQFRCVITYTVHEDASRVRQHLRCHSDRNRFDAVTLMLIDEERVTGQWADNVYSLSGTLAGRVTDKGFDIRLYSSFFQARMTVLASACEQSVKVIPETRGTIGPLTAALKKC
jgi:hypothetical protein